MSEFTSLGSQVTVVDAGFFKARELLGAFYDDQIRFANNSDAIVSILNQIMTIAEEEFFSMGICRNRNGYMVVKSYFHNVPQTMPKSSVYPTPAPTNPCQYYIDPQNSSTLLLRTSFAYDASQDQQLSASVFEGCCIVTKDR